MPCPTTALCGRLTKGGGVVRSLVRPFCCDSREANTVPSGVPVGGGLGELCPRNLPRRAKRKHNETRPRTATSATAPALASAAGTSKGALTTQVRPLDSLPQTGAGAWRTGRATLGCRTWWTQPASAQQAETHSDFKHITNSSWMHRLQICTQGSGDVSYPMGAMHFALALRARPTYRTARHNTVPPNQPADSFQR
jgi:hypothetical protein